MSRAKRVAMIAAGGTIAMGARHPFDWIDYADSGIVRDATELAGELGDLLPGVEMRPIAFRALGSVAIGWTDWCELLAVAEQAVRDDPDLAGIVITHGTATLEETAYFLHLTWTGRVPIALVGAQRPIGTHGSDAIPNVRAALATVTCPMLGGGRVHVVMNGEVHHPFEVTKSANFLVDAFTSAIGPVGRVEADGGVSLLRPVAPLPARRFVPAATPPRVDMVLSHAGADRVAIDAFVAAGCAGLVAVALPPGRVASGQRAALVEAAQGGVLVVVASRAVRDGLPVQDYNVRDGILVAGRLAAHKARILMMLALGEGVDRADIQTMMLDSE